MTSVNSYSSITNRVTGLVSGLDVDSIVKSLMEAAAVPLTTLKQKQQLAEWKQDAYREVSNQLRAFADKYFSYTNAATNMLAQSTYQQYAVTSTDESVVTIAATAGAQTGSHRVAVSSLATSATYSSSTGLTKEITASAGADWAAAADTRLVLTIDGTAYSIELDDSIATRDDLQAAVDNAVGSGKIVVADTNGDGSGYLTITKAAASGIGTIALSNGDQGDALAALGFTGGDELTNYLDTSASLATIAARLGFDFDADGKVSLTINGVNFGFAATTTLAQMMDQINQSVAGVTMAYSSTDDSLTLTAKQSGAGNTIRLGETGSTFLAATGLSHYTAGKDASVTIDGQKYTRNSNSFTVNGITYQLKAESTGTQTVSVAQDTAAVYGAITNFVSDYNALIESINNTISEEYDRDYQPLTDDQKAEMSDEEITAWEEKAKTGLLENDMTLTNLLSNMRAAFYTSVAGVAVNLTEIGITTSSNYEDKGKLIIDEATLKNAIASDPAAVMNLFAQASASYPGTTSVINLTASQRSSRTSEEGLAYKIYDLLQDNISTYTGINGNKGFLIEKAGLENSSSASDNVLSQQISQYQAEIDELTEKLAAKEDYYYEKYSAMETYINTMNSQLTALQSYFDES
jgi:flagellar hook-associated protein 2